MVGEEKLDWIGQRSVEGQSRNIPYVLVDRGAYYECLRVSGFYEFIPSTEEKIGEDEVDVIAKRLKIMKAKEAAAASRIAANLQAEDDDDLVADVKRRRRDSEDLVHSMPVNDLKVRKQQVRKKRAKDLDGRDQAKSSTALGDVRKAEVDWDFEEGVASDDEEGAALSSDEVDDKAEEDVDDSEDEDKILTSYGESLSKMLQNQKQAQADQELQNYSDDDDDEPANSNVDSGNPRPQHPHAVHPSAHVPVNSQVQTEEKVKEDLLNLLKNNENVTIKVSSR